MKPLSQVQTENVPDVIISPVNIKWQPLWAEAAWWLLRFSRPLNCQSVRRFLPILSCWTWPEQTWEGHCDGRWMVCFTSWHICNVFTGVARPSSALRWLLDGRDWRFCLCACVYVGLFSPSGTLCLLHNPLRSFHFQFTTMERKHIANQFIPIYVSYIFMPEAMWSYWSAHWASLQKGSLPQRHSANLFSHRQIPPALMLKSTWN